MFQSFSCRSRLHERIFEFIDVLKIGLNKVTLDEDNMSDVARTGRGFENMMSFKLFRLGDGALVFSAA